MFSLTARIGPPMGESQNLGVGRPLLFSPMEGRDARAWVSLSLRNQVLSLAGGRRSSSGERQRGSPSQWAVGHPLERDTGSPWRGETQGPRFRSASGNRSSPQKGKTPLVLPNGGERRKGLGFAQPPGKSSLPRRERQRGSPSPGAAGHPLERNREGLSTRRMIQGAKRGSVKVSRPAMDPSMQGDSGLGPSSS